MAILIHGAIKTPNSQIACVKRCLQRCNMLKQGINITKTDDHAFKLIHINPSFGKCIQTLFQLNGKLENELPFNKLAISPLIQLIEQKEIEWIPNTFIISTFKNPKPLLKDTSFTFIELFAGIGGFRVGLEKIGGACVFGVEKDEEACSTYNMNFSSPIDVNDISDIKATCIPPHDILTAGFPCQPFTKAGAQPGFTDDRGKLFYEIIRILNVVQPRSFLLENVANIVEMDEGRSIAKIVEALAMCNYTVQYRVYNSQLLLPQDRDRVYIVGFLNGIVDANTFEWPDIHHQKCKIKDILEKDVNMKELPQGYQLTKNQWQRICDKEKRRFKKRKLAGKSAKYINDRLVDINGCAKTLMSSYKRDFMNISQFVPNISKDDPPRLFTPREFARIQGFPEDYRVDGEVCRNNPNRIYHQIGNAVSPPIIECIGTKMLECLNDS